MEGAVTLAVLDRLKVTDRCQRLGGALVPEGGEGMELLTTLVVREIGHLDFDYCERILLGGDGPWDLADDLEGEVGDNPHVLVLFGHHFMLLKRCFQLPEPEFRVLIIKPRDRELQVWCPGRRVDVGGGLDLICAV